MIAWIASAHAGVLVAGLGGGVEFATDQPWAGADVSLQATNEKGLAPVGRLAGGVAFDGLGPLAVLEVGLLAVAPEDEAIVRAGIAVRTIVSTRPHRFLVDLWEGEERHLGLTPGVMGLLELQLGRPEAPHTLGFEGGPSAWLMSRTCGDLDDPEVCLGWRPGFVAAFRFRKRFESGLSLDARLGTTLGATVGWAF